MDVVQSSGQIDISGQSEVAVFRGNAAVISEGVVKFNYNAAEAQGNGWQKCKKSFKVWLNIFVVFLQTRVLITSQDAEQ